MPGQRRRRMLLWATVVSFGTLQVASAAPCMTPREKHAFVMRGMQSQLMVVALHCNDGSYDAFVQQHKADLTDAYEQIRKYFARVNRTSGETERDVYITELANAQERSGLRQTDYCVGMRDFVLDALAIQTDYDMEAVLIRSGMNVSRFQVCSEQGTMSLGDASATTRSNTRAIPNADPAQLRALMNRIENRH
jgi:hypothetical protein